MKIVFIPEAKCYTIGKHIYPVTDWYEDTQPEHVGIYERDIEGTRVFGYWDGYGWYVSGRDVDRAWMHYAEGGISSSFQLTDHTHRWRGLKMLIAPGDLK